MTERDLTPDRGGVTTSGYPRFHETQETPNPNQTASTPAKSATGELAGKVSDDIASVKQTAKDQLSGATEKANEIAVAQKNVIASKLGGVAAAMEKVAAELEQGDQRDIGRLTRTVGSSMRTFSDDIKDRSLGEVAQMAEDFGRKQPFAFLGLAAIAGLAASRFLTASADRQASASSASDTTSSPIGEDRFNG
jgi:ElaB/YqjD/DUF883 family membrane-anchored ribosome-binding protein